MFRVYAKQLHPRLEIYVSPVNIDPLTRRCPLLRPLPTAGPCARHRPSIRSCPHTACASSPPTCEPHLSHSPLHYPHFARFSPFPPLPTLTSSLTYRPHPSPPSPHPFIHHSPPSPLTHPAARTSTPHPSPAFSNHSPPPIPTHPLFHYAIYPSHHLSLTPSPAIPSHPRVHSAAVPARDFHGAMLDTAPDLIVGYYPGSADHADRARRHPRDPHHTIPTPGAATTASTRSLFPECCSAIGRSAARNPAWTTSR